MSERPANEIRTAWEDVSERLTGWGRLVAERYRTSEPAAATTEAAPTTDRKLDETARDLGDQLNRAFTALGDTLRDEAAKEELRGAMKAFGDAMSLSVSEAADPVRRRVGSSSHATQSGPAASGATTERPNGATTEASAAGAARDDDPMPPPPAA